MAFSPACIAAGPAAGARVEVDINPLAHGDWEVIHDATLDRVTTGAGPVAAMSADALSGLRLRDRALAASCGADLVTPFRAAGRQVNIHAFRDAGPSEVAAVRGAVTACAEQITTDDPAGLLDALGHPVP